MNSVVHNDIIKVDDFGIIDTVVDIPRSSIQINAEWISDTEFITLSETWDQSGWVTERLDVRKFDLNYSFNDSVRFGVQNNLTVSAQMGLSFLDSSRIYAGGTLNWQGVSFSPQQSYYQIAKTNSGLDSLWEKHISYNNDYLNLWHTLATKDGGVLLSGAKYNSATSNGNERDILIVKLDSSGTILSVNNETGMQLKDVIIYPNPATDNIYVKGMSREHEITISTMEGKPVLKGKIQKNLPFSISSLSQGMYLYSLTDLKSKKQFFGKLLKL